MHQPNNIRRRGRGTTTTEVTALTALLNLRRMGFITHCGVVSNRYCCVSQRTRNGFHFVCFLRCKAYFRAHNFFLMDDVLSPLAHHTCNHGDEFEAKKNQNHVIISLPRRNLGIHLVKAYV